MSAILFSLVSTISSPALALDPPNNPQTLADWVYVLDVNTPDPTDDIWSTDWSTPTGQMDTDMSPVSCTGLDLPPNQPKNPDACGSLDIVPGGAGYWLYYDGDAADAPPEGWNSANRWWRDRLILKYADDNLLFLGRYRANAAHPDCPTTDACGTGAVKFCGPVYAQVEGIPWSGGAFEFCVRRAE